MVKKLKGIPALYRACIDGEKDLVTHLLQQKGINLAATCTEGWTALHCACKEGHTEIVRELLHHYSATASSVISKTTISGDITCIQLACMCMYGHLEIVKLLLKYPAARMNRGAQSGKEPLHIASEAGQIPVMDLLLRHGVDINSPTHDRSHLTALQLATIAGQEASVRWLLDHGASVHKPREDNEGMPNVLAMTTPPSGILGAYLERGYCFSKLTKPSLDRIKLLTEFDYDISQFNSHTTDTDIVCSLWELGVEVSLTFSPQQLDVNINQVEFTRLVHGMYYRFSEDCDCLIAFNARHLFLQRFAVWGDVFTVQLILENTYDAQSLLEHEHVKNRNSILYMAAANSDNLALVIMLLSRYPQQSQFGYASRTALMSASAKGAVGIVRLLLHHYPEMINAQEDVTKQTALHSAMYASTLDNSEVVSMLLAAGADYNLQDNFGVSPLQLAKRSMHNGVRAKKYIDLFVVDGS